MQVAREDRAGLGVAAVVRDRRRRGRDQAREGDVLRVDDRRMHRRRGGW